MKTYVALLRGINVGGNNKVEMAKLKKCCEAVSFSDVRTYINSGNVIFKSNESDQEKLASTIERAIKKDFGLSIPVVIRDYANIKKLANKIPSDWTNDTEQKTDVLFLWEEFASKKTLDLIKTNPAVDTLVYIDGAIVWHIDKKDYTKSKMKDFIGTSVYKGMTARNVNTLRKLHELMSE